MEEAEEDDEEEEEDESELDVEAEGAGAEGGEESLVRLRDISSRDNSSTVMTAHPFINSNAWLNNPHKHEDQHNVG